MLENQRHLNWAKHVNFIVVDDDIDNTRSSIKLVIIEVAFTMETMALELMDYSLNWTLDPFHSVVYSRQDNFSKMEDICKQNLFNLKLNTLEKNIFLISN